MTNEELKMALQERKALVVHFSTHAMTREGAFFPKDLHNAIEKKNQWTLSCCAIWPGHAMDLPGSVGVIFEPTVDNVVSVSGDDSGSGEVDGEEVSEGKKLTDDALKESFNATGFYNEWRVRGAEVKGIFVADPCGIVVRKPFIFKGDEMMGTFDISLEEIIENFPGQDLYTLCGDEIVKLKRGRDRWA
jgi:hypothetical protein